MLNNEIIDNDFKSLQKFDIMATEKVERCLNIKFYVASSHVVALDSQNMQRFFFVGYY